MGLDNILVTIVGTAAIRHGITAFLAHKVQEVNVNGTKIHPVGHVTSLNIFPVKSAGAICPNEALCTRTGLLTIDNQIHDRQWSICVRTKNDYYQAESRREMPQIALIRSTYNGKILQLDAPGMKTLEVACDLHCADTTKHVKIRVAALSKHQPLVEAVDCGEKASQWLQTFLQHTDIRLTLVTPDITLRHLDRISETGNLEHYDVQCQDTSPFMLASQASLDCTNERLSTQVPMLQFRPNIEVSGCEAFDEDDWEEIMIGDVIFSKMERCYRCMLITVCEHCGHKDQNKEPFKTLLQFRPNIKIHGMVRPYFGVWYKLLTPGKIAIGDTVWLVKESNPALHHYAK